MHRRLVSAVEQGDPGALKELFQMEGADIRLNAAVDGRTPLHHAVLSESLEVTSVLLDQGAEVLAKARNYETSLHLAAEKESEAIFSALLKKVDDAVDVNVFDKRGWMPLHVAAA